MSEPKLHKFLQTNTVPTVSVRSVTPVILSDSKGRFLSDQVDPVENVESQIIWWSESGAKIQDRYNWLTSNLDREINQIGNIHLFIWLGTCNLTKKSGKFIQLAHNDDTEVELITYYIGKIIDLLKGYTGSRVTFLEIPEYSIVSYNKYHGHHNPSSFRIADKELQSQIYTLNGKIRDINESLNTISPEFTSDLRTKRTFRRRRRIIVQHYTNFSLYSDGIHPKNLLARYWLRKLAIYIANTCWHSFQVFTL